jgi:hypothetical protein
MGSKIRSTKSSITVTTTIAAVLGILFSTMIPYALAFEVSQPNKQLTAKWWEWVLAIPPEDNPLVDETGENCDVDQSI